MLKKINKIAGIKNNKNCNSNLANKNNIVIKVQRYLHINTIKHI